MEGSNPLSATFAAHARTSRRRRVGLTSRVAMGWRWGTNFVTLGSQTIRIVDIIFVPKYGNGLELATDPDARSGRIPLR